VEQKDDWDQVQAAVLALPIQQRVVVVLYYLNDLSLQEISKILATPIGTVKSRLHYGRKALKKRMSLGNFGEAKPLADLNYERS